MLWIDESNGLLYGNDAKETALAKCIDKYEATSYSLSQAPLEHSPSGLCLKKKFPAWEWPDFITESDKGLYNLKETVFPEVWFQRPEY